MASINSLIDWSLLHWCLIDFSTLCWWRVSETCSPCWRLRRNRGISGTLLSRVKNRNLFNFIFRHIQSISEFRTEVHLPYTYCRKLRHGRYLGVASYQDFHFTYITKLPGSLENNSCFSKLVLLADFPLKIMIFWNLFVVKSCCVLYGVQEPVREQFPSSFGAQHPQGSHPAPHTGSLGTHPAPYTGI